MTKTMARVRAATRDGKTLSHREGNPAATLTRNHARSAVSTISAASGRDANRSNPDSSRLPGDRPRSTGGSGSDMPAPERTQTTGRFQRPDACPPGERAGTWESKHKSFGGIAFLLSGQPPAHRTAVLVDCVDVLTECGQDERYSGEHTRVGALAGGKRAGLAGEAEQLRGGARRRDE